MRALSARAALLAACLLAAAPAATPAAGGAREDEILMLGNRAGAQSVRTGSDGVAHAEYSFNDRGRGDHIVATPPEVLRMATLTSATVIGANDERGVITAGKLADLILVDGDPSVRIGDLDRIDLVMKGGRLYEPARIEAALGITPARREGL